LDDLYDPTLNESEHVSKSSKIGCFVQSTLIGMILNMLGSVVYNPLLDDSEHASK